MWPLCHRSYPTPPTAWCPVPWRRESPPEDSCPSMPSPLLHENPSPHRLKRKKGLTEMDLNSLPNGGACPSDFGVSRRVTTLFLKHLDRISRTSSGIWTRYFGFDYGPLSTLRNNSLNSVYSRPSLCSFINKWYFNYKTKIFFCLNAHDLSEDV